MHSGEMQYIMHYCRTKNNTTMHDLETNYEKFHNLTKTFFHKELNEEGNFHFYPNPPKLSDSQVISLALCQEALGIDSEHYFWQKLRSDYEFLGDSLPHLTCYNRRRKNLASSIHQLTERISQVLNEGEDVWLVDSIPIPVCKISREHQTKVCREHFESAPDKGYSPILQQHYIGYKLHLVTSAKGVFYSMDMTKASCHDVHYLSNVKHSGLNNCVLLGDKGYLSSEKRIDLFSSVGVRLQTPKRRNQKDYRPYPHVYKKCRRRIETLFSQLCDQMMLKRNYAKTVRGLSTRIICKIGATTALQYFNHQNKRPINHIKHALAA